MSNTSNTNSVAPTFTAAHIARAAGITRQAATARLRDVPGGDGWRFSALPIDWQLEITRRGVKRGYANGEDYLLKLTSPWAAPVPWERLPEKHRTKAERLQRALASPLQLRCNGISGADLDKSGMEAYRLEFGYSLKDARHWRRLFQRTIDRDAGEENWLRKELYLDDRAFIKPKPSATLARTQYAHEELAEFIRTMDCGAEPDEEDRRYVWDAAFRHYDRLVSGLTDSPDGNRCRREVKASLVRFLFSAFPAGVLCGSEKALRNRFDEKIQLWRKNGEAPEALRDHRSMRSGNFRRPHFAEDFKKVRNLAIQLDGNEALAHRMLREKGELSKEFCQYYNLDLRRNKSRLAVSVRNAITPGVEMVLPLRRGPWQAKMRGPYIPRDWSGVKPGDWFCADDVTWNHYYRELLPDGRWQVLRGECLLMTDLRTGYPLDFLLVPGKYNGEHVRSLVLRVHDVAGLPRHGYYFEKGVWASRLVAGDRKQGAPVHWRETENGLANPTIGLKCGLRHATTPRAKPIEGLLRIMQERMRCIPGFVGFNEREYDAERVQKLIARAHRNDSEAVKQFPTAIEWKNQIAQVLEDFTHDPQNGKMLDGASPAEAWGVEIRLRPLRKLPDDARHILSTHRKKVMIRQEGIILTIRGKKRLYYNELTGRPGWIRHEVLASYNIEMPELLMVCDCNLQNYFSVRSVELPAMTATKEQFENVTRLRRGHMAGANAIFGELRHEVVANITRDSEHSAEEKVLGQFVREETEKAKSEAAATKRTLRKVHIKAAAAGIKLEGQVRNPDEALEALTRREFFRRRMQEKEASQNNES
jgi:hypothetical protein